MQPDLHYMRYAIRLARRGLGKTAPNPSVGCVIVKNNKVVGLGNTSKGGRPHAEVIALNMAGGKAEGADVYVTLEPCSHHGVTPPCSQALINAKVSNVFIACLDINPLVNGNGVDMMRKAGINVITNVLKNEAREVNESFFLTQEEERPFVTLKTAMSLDGKIALENGESQWITGDLARKKTHQLRSQHDAILCGIGTMLKDNATLTTRLAGVCHLGIRILLDTNLRIDVNSRLLKSIDNAPIWIIHNTSNDTKIRSLEDISCKVFKHDTNDLKGILKLISKEGVTRLLVEGGAEIHSSFLNSNLWDQLSVFRSSKILGGHSKDSFSKHNLQNLDNAYNLDYCDITKLGEDNLITYKNTLGKIYK